jgi:hypothetical protein
MMGQEPVPPRSTVTARGEVALQQQRVDPAAVLVAYRSQPSGIHEPAYVVERRRGGVSGVGDDGDHLTDASPRAFRQQPLEKEPAQTLSRPLRRKIDGVLDRVPQ